MTTDRKQCKRPHETWGNCSDPSCVRNCENFDNILYCNVPCKAGCVCEKGYLRNDKGDCVKPNKCGKYSSHLR